MAERDRQMAKIDQRLARLAPALRALFGSDAELQNQVVSLGEGELALSPDPRILGRSR